METSSFDFKERIAILGGGNIGVALAKGIVASGKYVSEQITITRRQVHLLDELKQQGFGVQSDNCDAVRNARMVIIAVRPQQLITLLEEIRTELIPGKHIVVSLVTGVSIQQIIKYLGKEVWVIRAMPNTAIAIGESMTCLAAANTPEEVLNQVKALFDTVGMTLVIEEQYIIPATALCACGIAFFLRSIRAASQGGIEIGFHWDEALLMAAQTAKGAAALLLSAGNHPEAEIDKVTTPRGCTIAGLNEMEHHGFSSAMIKGIVTSAEKAAKLFVNAD